MSKLVVSAAFGSLLLGGLAMAQPRSPYADSVNNPAEIGTTLLMLHRKVDP